MRVFEINGKKVKVWESMAEFKNRNVINGIVFVDANKPKKPRKYRKAKRIPGWKPKD